MSNAQKIYVAGHRGLVGSAIMRRLQAGGYTNLIGRTHKELDLLNQQTTNSFLKENVRSTYSLLRPGLEVFMPTIPTQPTSSTKT